jgi:hypothetical protein
MEREALHTYLNDHLGGAAAGLQVVEYLTGSAATPEEKQIFERLYAEISEDRDMLNGLIAKTGKEPSSVRQAGGWIAAKISQLKLAIDNPTAGSLAYFEALEVLALGILGKRSLWRALTTVSDLPELQGVDLQDLERRAADQYDRVEERRMAVARHALTAGT